MLIATLVMLEHRVPYSGSFLWWKFLYIVEHHTKIKTPKISLHNNYVLRHYAELYKLQWVVHTKFAPTKITRYTVKYNTQSHSIKKAQNLMNADIQTRVEISLLPIACTVILSECLV